MKKVGLIVGVLLSLTACTAQYTSNGEQKYLQSLNGANLVVRPPLTSANISDFYNLPPQTQDARVSIAPPG